MGMPDMKKIERVFGVGVLLLATGCSTDWVRRMLHAQ